MAVNKVVYGDNVLIDLTSDTVTAETLLKGYTAHKADGTIIVGTMEAGASQSEVDALNARIAELEAQLEHAILDSSAEVILDSSAE